jgi:hypothetical protein
VLLKTDLKLFFMMLKWKYILTTFSGVSDQPLTDRETLLGARNRADRSPQKNSPMPIFGLELKGVFRLKKTAWLHLHGLLFNLPGKKVKRVQQHLFYPKKWHIWLQVVWNWEQPTIWFLMNRIQSKKTEP